MHENIFQFPLVGHNFVDQLFSDMSTTKPKMGVATPRVHVAFEWNPHPTVFVKINVDAGLSKNTDWGFVTVVVRDAARHYQGASNISFIGPFEAETMEAVARAGGFGLGFGNT